VSKKSEITTHRPSASCFRAVGLEGFAGVGLAGGGHLLEESEDAEDAAFAALRLQFAFDLVGVSNHIDAIEIRKPDVAERGGNAARVIEL
jgi:hypothetical protein